MAYEKLVWKAQMIGEKWLLGQHHEPHTEHKATVNGEWIMGVLVYADRVEWMSSDEPGNKIVRGRAKNLREGKAAAKAAWRRA